MPDQNARPKSHTYFHQEEIGTNVASESVWCSQHALTHTDFYHHEIHTMVQLKIDRETGFGLKKKN